MPTQQINDVAGVWGTTAQTQDNEIVEVVNNSAGARAAGDVVVIDATGTLANTTTTVNDRTVFGVVCPKVGPATTTSTDSYAVGAVMPVLVRGIGRINIAANAVAASDVLTTSGVAGVAITNAGAPAANAVLGSLIGIALEASGAKDANNTIRAKIRNF